VDGVLEEIQAAFDEEQARLERMRENEAWISDCVTEIR
jgi:hypothetical protein